MVVLQDIFFSKPIQIAILTNSLLIKASFTSLLISSGTTTMWTGQSLPKPTFTGFKHI